MYEKPHNAGDDVAGTVAKLGANVSEFHVGDRVAGFHVMMDPHGSFAEYSIVPRHLVFAIPKNISFEQAATIPLAAMTAAIGLFDKLGLPSPLKPAETEIPLLVYGGSSAVGAYAIKLAKLANIHPIIAVAGSGSEFAASVGADKIVDYRKGNVVQGIKDALGGKQLLHAYDAISEGDSLNNIRQVVAKGGKSTRVLPTKEDLSTPDLSVALTMVGSCQKGSNREKDFGLAYYQLMARWLQTGEFEPHPHQVIPNGLGGVEEGLRLLQDGKVSAKKVIFRIAETPGLSS